MNNFEEHQFYLKPYMVLVINCGRTPGMIEDNFLPKLQKRLYVQISFLFNLLEINEKDN